MKKKSAIIYLLLFIQMSYAQFWKSKEVLIGNAHIITQEINIPEFNQISVSGMFDVKLFISDSNIIKVTADENLMQAIDIFVKSKKLFIRTHPDFRIKKFKKLSIEVPVSYLSKITLTGSGSIICDEKLEGEHLELNLTGPGDIDFKIDYNKAFVDLTGSGDVSLSVKTDQLNVNLTGSGDVILSGETEDLNITLTGSGDISAKKLKAKNVKVNIAGSGDVYVYPLKRLTGKILGSGDIIYYNDPDFFQIKILGSGDVTKR